MGICIPIVEIYSWRSSTGSSGVVGAVGACELEEAEEVVLLATSFRVLRTLNDSGSCFAEFNVPCFPILKFVIARSSSSWVKVPPSYLAQISLLKLLKEKRKENIGN